MCLCVTFCVGSSPPVGGFAYRRVSKHMVSLVTIKYPAFADLAAYRSCADEGLKDIESMTPCLWQYISQLYSFHNLREKKIQRQRASMTSFNDFNEMDWMDIAFVAKEV